MLTEKAQLRKELQAQREALGSARREEAGTAVCAQVVQNPVYQQANTLFTYVSVSFELDTRELIQAALAAHKQVCVPRCASFGQMDALAITSLNDLAEGKYGLLEPRQGLPLVAPAAIDLVLVPCLAATASGQRLGYGGGFYDRYLARLSASARSFVLCYKEFLRASLPTEHHDMPVNQVICG